MKRPFMRASNKRLTLLTEAEKSALYSLPDFDETQRAEYLTLTQAEQALIYERSNPSAQLYCALQIGYFKAKQTFFGFKWEEVASEDITWILKNYLPAHSPPYKALSKYEYYNQQRHITNLFGYRLWSNQDSFLLQKKTAEFVKRDMTPSFILLKLVSFLKEQKLVIPTYTQLQNIISNTLTHERKRLEKILHNTLSEVETTTFKKLLVQENSLSKLAALKQDSKNFGFTMMKVERQKLSILNPLYSIAKTVVPQLEISQQNLHYYASLVHYYTIYDLRRLQAEQATLYLLCYVWQRYQQLTDNLAEAFCYWLKQFEEEIKEQVREALFQQHIRQRYESFAIGSLLSLYVNEDIPDDLPYGNVRQQAFAIMPKELLSGTASRLTEKPLTELSIRWQVIDAKYHRFKKHLRPLALALDFTSNSADNSWIRSLEWFKHVFSCQQSLSQQSPSSYPKISIPERLKPYLWTIDKKSAVLSLNTKRYELWLYRQLGKRLGTGEIYLENSFQHRCFNQELFSLNPQNIRVQKPNIPGLQEPLEKQLETLLTQLHQLWLTFNKKLRQGQLKHLKYDSKTRTLRWLKPKKSKSEEITHAFYSQLACRDIKDILYFVNNQCHFLSAFTHLTPRYTKQSANEKNLLAVIIAQGMNHGNFRMAEASDIPYHVLEETYAQYLRLSTLKAANDKISNAIAQLSIFPYYSFDLEILYGSVDGQKYEVEPPTLKARHSRKYFGKGKGVVAYTLLANHIPLQTQLIGAHEHESYYLFDIWYQNTSTIEPTAITGDMHCINKANFALMHWFGPQLRPRFADITNQLKHLYCPNDLANYQNFYIQPVGIINPQLILGQKLLIERILITLAHKEITQSTLIKKLCTHTYENPIRKAVFEFDKLIRSIYTLNYLIDPNLYQNVNRSQNRIEEYHQLRAAIARVGGKKQLIGKTDLELAISNQCGRLIANALLYYNSFLLSKLFNHPQYSQDPKRLALLKKTSPVAWQHAHFLGHYSFDNNNSSIDLDRVIKNLLRFL